MLLSVLKGQWIRFPVNGFFTALNTFRWPAMICGIAFRLFWIYGDDVRFQLITVGAVVFVPRVICRVTRQICWVTRQTANAAVSALQFITAPSDTFRRSTNFFRPQHYVLPLLASSQEKPTASKNTWVDQTEIRAQQSISSWTTIRVFSCFQV